MNRPAVAHVWSVPSKVFLLGEYHVISGGSGILLTLAPRFELTAPVSTAGVSAWNDLHPESPAGKLRRFGGQSGISMEAGGLPDWRDPFNGSGGFGASSAQFALLYAELAERLNWEMRWESVWRLFRELTKSTDGMSPSGADLVAQWRGGAVALVSSLGEGATPWRARDVFPFLDASLFLVFQTDRKVATHTHLAEQESWGREVSARCEGVLEVAFDAIEERAWNQLGCCLTEYAEILAARGLEDPRSQADRKALMKLPDVIGVKGAGALLADTLIVLIKPGTHGAARTTVIQAAEARGLKLVSDGLTSEIGVQRKVV